MQANFDRSHQSDDIKTQFRAREGYYRLMNSPDYSQRSQRAMGFSTGTTNSNSSASCSDKTCIKISLVRTNGRENPNSVSAYLRQYLPTNQTQTTNNDLSTKGLNQRRGNKRIRDKKICFNVGRELFVYNYDGVRTGPDASNPIYKRSYKGSSPTCHDFNQATATPDSLSLLVGFSHGQVQLIDLNGSSDDQETIREYNEDRLIDKTRVTCIKWLPNSPSLFLVGHASGHLYLYKDDLPCGPAAPVYQLYKQSEGLTVYTCKTKTTRNPIYKWILGSQSADGNCTNMSSSESTNSLQTARGESFALNEFTFSPCAKYLACVSQDGFLRVYCYDTLELVGRCRSYYGGLSCVCWSPDGKYVVTGGEDDLITVWSFIERRVVARGVGHRSWVTVVSFDPFYGGHDLRDNDVANDDDEDEANIIVDDRDLEEDDDFDDTHNNSYPHVQSRLAQGRGRVETNHENLTDLDNRSTTIVAGKSPPQFASNRSPDRTSEPHTSKFTSYRFGSVGQDTQLCLWDLTEDLLMQPVARSKVNSTCGGLSNLTSSQQSSSNNHNSFIADKCAINDTDTHSDQVDASTSHNFHEPLNEASSSKNPGFLSSKGSAFSKTFSLVGKRDKRTFSLRASDKSSKQTIRSSSGNFNTNKLIEDPAKLLGSPICPRMNEVPILEPCVCKKISSERLTSLIFCKGGFITSCQDGYVFSWARPSNRSLRTHSPGQSNEELRVIDVGTSSVV